MSNRSVGVSLIVLGIILLLERLNIISFGNLIRIYWPMVFIFLGLLDILRERRLGYYNGILIIVGVFLQVDKLGILNTNVWRIFFPVILIFIGLMELRRD